MSDSPAAASAQSVRVSLLPAFTLVTFKVSAVTQLGETVCISGDHVDLGAFDPNEAREMVTSPTTYPIWTMNVLLPRDVPRNYKYLKWSFKRFKWEDLGTRLHRTIIPEGTCCLLVAHLTPMHAHGYQAPALP